MPDPELLRDRVRYIAVGLYRNHCVVHTSGLAVEMRHELIEGFRADAACIAVFEEQKGPLAGGCEETVELVESFERGQLWMHSKAILAGAPSQQ